MYGFSNVCNKGAWSRLTINRNVHLAVIFQDNLDNPVPEPLHSGSYWS